ncbi:apolipoprotein N-acyltransferase [Sulfuricella sp. T08]|uniref:apolipoprotein N-acyltransferase n=1 Tax=Sulfuricella sp. T08 TaxID=1632857 RepID=UPI000751297D|nr:apolipoprotein N-acyltransferase [Sulfuricella sp. T08]
MAFALILGAVSVSGFAPDALFFLPLLTLAALFLLWSRASSRKAAAYTGFAFGLGFFGAGVSWVYVSIHEFGGMPMLLAVVATFLFCLVLSLFPAAVGLLQAGPGGLTRRRALLLMPALWVLMEWVRGWLFTGFPWLALGYSQAVASPLAGFAPVIGVYGVSLISALCAGALALAADARLLGRGKAGMVFPAIIILVLAVAGFALKQVEWVKPLGAPVSVSLLQGNIPQEMKWREDKAKTTLDSYMAMTLASSGRLIVLPETALPMLLRDLPLSYLEMLSERARALGGDVLVGVPEHAESGDYFNSVLSLGSSPVQVYRKVHLVPFGEFIPFKPLFGWIIHVLHIPLSDFARGEIIQPPLQVAGQKVAMAICYEDVFGEELINQLPAASLLVNVSNDAWFGDTVAPWQHLQISQMRALEAGRYMLRATNTGITAIINQRGEVLKRAREFTVTRLEGEAQGFAGATPYVRFGNFPLLGLLGLLLAANRIAGKVMTAREKQKPGRRRR